ncbi:MAG: alpha-E domain-containing protein [Ferruginibacter sp.]
MLSRVADSLYWMSRYMERADGILRMLRINYASSQDDMQDFSWKPVLKIFSFLPDEKADELSPHTRSVLQFMVTDKENMNSVLNIVTQARENGRSVQDHITKEMWQCLNDFYHVVRQEALATMLQREDPISILDTLIKHGVLYFGTTDVTMSRGEGNSFINIGKFLERAIQTSDILDIKFSNASRDIDSPADATYWKYMLMSISGYELYLKTYRSGFNAEHIMEQVLLNETFPRSVLYSLNHLQQYFERLRNEKNIDDYNQVNFMIGKLRSKVKFSTSDSILQQGLHSFLTEIRTELFEIANAFSHHYFSQG